MKRKKRTTAASQDSASCASEEEEEQVEVFDEDDDEKEDHDYGDDSDFGEESECEEEEVKEVKEAKAPKQKRSRKQTRPPLFEKTLKAAKTVSDLQRRDEQACRLTFKRRKIEDEQLLLRIRQDQEDRERERRPQTRHLPQVLNEPVGFKETKEDAYTLEHRIKNSEKSEFKIDRTLFLKRTRYVPFGTDKFYKKPDEFYSSPTDLCCLWCTETFEGLPIPLPLRLHENPIDKNDYAFHVTGQFCSPSCMLAQMKRSGPVVLGRVLLKRLYGIGMRVEIPFAPDPRSLRKFGGLYSIEEFRGTGGSGIHTHLVLPPLIPVTIGITEIEKTITVVTEVGGKELACRRVALRGGGIGGGTFAPFSNPNKKHLQRGKFCTAPTIEEQISASDRKLRLQMQDSATSKKKKRPNIMSFMKLKSTTM